MKQPKWPKREEQKVLPPVAPERKPLQQLWILVMDGQPLLCVQAGGVTAEELLEIYKEDVELPAPTAAHPDGHRYEWIPGTDATDDQLRRLGMMIELKTSVRALTDVMARQRARKAGLYTPGA